MSLPFFIPEYLNNQIFYLSLKEDIRENLVTITGDILAVSPENFMEEKDFAYLPLNLHDEGNGQELYLYCIPHKNPTPKQKWFAKELCFEKELDGRLKNVRENEKKVIEDSLEDWTKVFYTPEMTQKGYVDTVCQKDENRVTNKMILKQVRSIGIDIGLEGDSYRDGFAFNVLAAITTIEKEGFKYSGNEDIKNICVDGYNDGGIDYVFFEYHGKVITNPLQLYLVGKQENGFDGMTIYVGQSKFYTNYNEAFVSALLFSINHFTEIDPILPLNEGIARFHDMYTHVIHNLKEGGTVTILPYYAFCGKIEEEHPRVRSDFILLERNLLNKNSVLRLEEIRYLEEKDFLE